MADPRLAGSAHRHVENLPPHHRGGLYNDLAVGHEDLLWSIRAEPELIKVFSELWGTDELLVSFGESTGRTVRSFQIRVRED